MEARASVVLVNGLWLGNAALWPLARRLRRAGFRVYPFSYPSVRRDLRANADRLRAFLERVPGDTVHLVGYSLGGVVLRALFHYCPPARPGRIVLLGSPQQGNHVARSIAHVRFWRLLLGHSVQQLISGRVREWSWPARETGIIAGSRPIGLGRLVADLPGPSDGTVLISETDVPGARDRIVLPVAHSALLLSAAAARQIIRFLQHGRFEHPGVFE